MPIIRMSKTSNFTQFNNDAFSGAELSGLAKAVKGFALTRGDDWIFSINGIAYHFKEGPDAIGRAVKELEENGFVSRDYIRDGGKFKKCIYTWYEDPSLNPVFKKSGRSGTSRKRERPVTLHPTADIPIPDISGPVKHDISNNELNNIIDISLIPSINQDLSDLEAKIRRRIEVDILSKQFDKRILDNIVSVMVGVYMHKNATIQITRDKILPTSYVQEQFDKIGVLHIEQIMRSLERCNPNVKNMWGYLMIALINVTTTMDTAYQYGDY